MTTVGVDLGGTHVRAAIVEGDGRVLRRHKRPTPHDVDQPTVLVDLVRDMLASSEGAEARDVVIGVPGVVDYDDERLCAAPNLPKAWIGSISGAWLSERLDRPVALANDADLAAVGEAAFGAGRGCRDLAYVTISTGIGAGLILGGRLVHGRFSGAELGHTVIDRRAAADGGPATVELLGSGRALARLSAEAGEPMTARTLAARVRAGDAEARLRWDEALGTAALGVVNLCWIGSPQRVIVGGGVGMNNADLFLPELRRALERHGPPFLDIQVAAAELGDDAGLSGAAAWCEAVGRG